MKKFLFVVATVLFSTITMQNLFAQTAEETNKVTEKKIALVIGNSHYDYGTKSKASMDAMSVASVLGDTGFSVSLVLDGDQRKLLDSVQQFCRDIKNADVCLFYYSGNGIASNSVNYLLPVNATITTEEDLTFKAVSINDILEKVAKAKCNKNIMIIDARLDTGFLDSDEQSTRSLSMTTPSESMESLIAFASAPSDIASSGESQNSPFTEAFLNNILKPGVDIRIVFGQITKDVKNATDNQQVVVTNSTLTDEFCIVPSDSNSITKFNAPDINMNENIFTTESSVPTAELPASAAQKFQMLSGSKGFIPTATLRIKTLSAGDLYINDEKVYTFVDDREIEFGNIINDTYNMKMVYRYGNEEAFPYDLNLQSAAVQFTYEDSNPVHILSKSPGKVYINEEYKGKIEKNKQWDSDPLYYESYNVKIVYQNDYSEVQEVNNLETEKTKVVNFIYKDGGSSSARFCAGIFNPLLGIGSAVQGDGAGVGMVVLGEALGGATIGFSYYLRNSWTSTAVANGYTEDDIDFTIPDIIMYSGVGVLGITAFICLIRPQVFKSKAYVRKAKLKAEKKAKAQAEKKVIVVSEPQPEGLSFSVLPDSSVKATYIINW